MTKLALMAGAALLSAIAAQAQDPYKVVANVGTQLNGSTAYLYDYNTGEKTDSATVEAGIATFQGSVDEPYLATLRAGDYQVPIIIECGTAAFNGSKVFGSPLNDSYNELQEHLAGMQSSLTPVSTEEEQEAVRDKMLSYCDSVMEANLDNPLGAAVLIIDGLFYNKTLPEMEALIAKEPTLATYHFIDSNMQMMRRREATGEGKPYIDFEVNGQKLSDYVGKDGKYLLVDFWASWCGPCRREIPVIKKILEDNSDKLNVLGVAVWDEPDNTRKAMEQLGITWPVIIDAQRIPTDIYGILGIPTIMLISPDGTIVVRDKQGKKLKAAVEAALAR